MLLMLSSHLNFHFRIFLFASVLLCSCSGSEPSILRDRIPKLTEETLVNAQSIEVIQPEVTPADDQQQRTLPSQEVTVINFILTSSSFEHKGKIPVRNTCKAEDISPDLAWKEVPSGTKSFALIVDDPDALTGTWIHWVYYNIPGDLHELSEGIKNEKQFTDGSRNGTNSWGNIGYNGPCPPSGTHRYLFKLYAIDTILELSPGATKPELLKSIQGHILGMAELIGTFSK